MSRITRLLELETAIPSRSAWRTPLAIAISSMVAAGCLVSLDAPAGAAPVVVQQEQSQDRSFPSTDSMVDALRDEVMSGTLNAEQAIQIERIHERLLMAIDSGRVSTEQALEILKDRSAKVYEGAVQKAKGEIRQSKSMTTADYDAAVKKMTAMVKSGEITREQMEQRLARMKQRISAKPSATAADYAKAEADMTKMVEAGKLTPAQMEQRLARMRALMAASAMGAEDQAKRNLPTPPEGLSRMELREWYQRVVERLDMAVESGRMTVDEKNSMLEQIKSNLRK